MKQLKTIKRLTAFGLLVLMTACSTENTVIGNGLSRKEVGKFS